MVCEWFHDWDCMLCGLYVQQYWMRKRQLFRESVASNLHGGYVN